MYRKGQKTITNVYEEVYAVSSLIVTPATPACNYLHHSSFRSLRSVGTLRPC